MSRQRRNFSAKFKSDLVIELLKGEKDLNALAVENNIQPNLLRNWKKEFLDNASAVFDDKREDNLKEKLAEERKEKAEYAKKVGQLTMQVDWLKKNLKKFVDQTTRVSLVQNLLTTKEIPASVGAKLLDLNRTSIYYKGTLTSDEELACKEIIDHLHTDNPSWGARQMSAQLKSRGYHVGRRKARRYMNEMDIYPIYPKMNLSKRMQQAKVCPYLLRNAVIDKPNQARSIDITYIPIKRGFLYLTAVIDWHSRWADNIMIERWFRSFKYEEAYLTQYNNIKEARTAIGQYIRTYNFERHHSALDYQTPAECYYPAMLLPYVA